MQYLAKQITGWQIFKKSGLKNYMIYVRKDMNWRYILIKTFVIDYKSFTFTGSYPNRK